MSRHTDPHRRVATRRKGEASDSIVRALGALFSAMGLATGVATLALVVGFLITWGLLFITRLLGWS